MNKTLLEKIKLKNTRLVDVYVSLIDKHSNDTIIICHGFDSNKEGSVFRFLSDVEANVISFDLPMHGESDEELLLSNCIDDLKVVIEYSKDRFKNSDISLFGSSFGCYVVLNFLKKYPDYDFKKIFFKSAAIKMDKVFKDVLIEEDMDSFKKRGYTLKNRNQELLIPYKFYEELMSNKINLSDFSDRNIYFFHGKHDDVAFLDDLGDLNYPNFHLLKFDSNHNFSSDLYVDVINNIHKVLK